MSREIKFRVWNGHEMCLVLQIHFDVGELLCESMGIMKVKFLLTMPKFKLMQFTGLHDRNGVEIYEGDVLAPSPERGKHGNRVCEYIDGSFCYSPPIGNKGWWALNRSKCKYFEVIGNVHQHPELLTAKEDSHD